MQLYACEEKGRFVVAHSAKKGINYLCPECRGTVRVRGGRHRKPHFFHLTHNEKCRQSGKSQIHLAIQNYLLHLLPDNEVTLECRFSEIQRIADVVWMPKRLIFEVQCSPITAEEVQQRNQDYERLGFQVVWIFHDRRFNRWRVTAAEETLMDRPFYFTNMDAEGRGMIYDQTCLIQKGIRRERSERSEVDLSRPLAGNNGQVRFEGDCRDQSFVKPNRNEKQPKNWLKWYWVLFRMLLERASR